MASCSVRQDKHKRIVLISPQSQVSADPFMLEVHALYIFMIPSMYCAQNSMVMIRPSNGERVTRVSRSVENIVYHPSHQDIIMLFRFEADFFIFKQKEILSQCEGCLCSTNAIYMNWCSVWKCDLCTPKTTSFQFTLYRTFPYQIKSSISKHCIKPAGFAVLNILKCWEWWLYTFWHPWKNINGLELFSIKLI